MATIEERVALLENEYNDVKSTLDRHSTKISELFGLKDTIFEVKTNMKQLDQTVKELRVHQLKTDRQLLFCAKLTIVLIGILIGVFVWIGSKSPDTASQLASVVVSAGKAI